MYDITDINESIPGSSGIMPATKKGRLCVNIQQVDGTEWVHILGPQSFTPR